MHPLHLGLLLFASPSPGVETCLPRVGELRPLARPIRAQAGIVVRVFEPTRTDAEFRGCEADTCELMLHARAKVDGRWRRVPADARGFGEDVIIPREDLGDLVQLPPCPPVTVPEPPPKKVARPKRRPRRPKRAKPAPAPPPAPEPAPLADEDARAAVAPDPAALIARLAATDAGLGAQAGSGAADAVDAVIVGRPMPLNSRVAALIGEDGALTFTANTGGAPPGAPSAPADAGRDTLDGHRPMVGGLGGSGEGLNALDGADIDAPLKRAFARATFAARQRLYWRARGRAIAASLGTLHAQLRALEARPPAEARAAVFALWDAHADNTAPAPNAAYGDAGAQARALIEDWIARHLPAGPRGFSADEVARLNAQVGRGPSRRTFDPYAAPARRAALLPEAVVPGRVVPSAGAGASAP